MNHFDRDLNPRAVVDIHGKDYPSAGSWGLGRLHSKAMKA